MRRRRQRRRRRRRGGPTNVRRAHSANQRTTRGKTQATRATHKPREINARPVNVIETFAIKHENHTVHTFAARVQQRWQRCKVAAAASASATAAAAAAAAVSGGGGGVCARATNIANESQTRHSASTCNQEHIAEEYAGNYCVTKHQRTQVLRERQWRTRSVANAPRRAEHRDGVARDRRAATGAVHRTAESTQRRGHSENDKREKFTSHTSQSVHASLGA